MRSVSLAIDCCRGWSGGSAVATSTSRLVYVSGCHIVVHSYGADRDRSLDVRVLRFGSASNSSDRPVTASPSKAAGRAKAVSCVDVSPDGRYVVAGETGHCPRLGVWDLDDASPLPRTVVHDRHTFGVKHVRFDRSSSRFLSVGVANDGAIHVYSLKSSAGGCQLLASNRVTNALRDVRWLTDTVIATCGVRHLKLFTLPPADDSEPDRVGVLDARQVVLGNLLDETIVGVLGDTHCSSGAGCRLLTASGVLASFDLETRTVTELDRFEDGRALLAYRGEVVVATRSGVAGHVQEADVQEAMVLQDELLRVARRGDIRRRGETIASARPLAGIALIHGELKAVHRDLQDAALTDSTASASASASSSSSASGNRVTSVAVTPTGQLLRGTASGELLIGDDADSQRVHLHESPILHISACGELVLTMAQDRTLQILRNFELLQTWVEPRSNVTWASLADSGTIVLATLDRTLKWLVLREDGKGFELAETVDLRATVVIGCVCRPTAITGPAASPTVITEPDADNGDRSGSGGGSSSNSDATSASAGAEIDGYLALRDRSIVRLIDPQTILARTEEVVDRIAIVGTGLGLGVGVGVGAGAGDDYLVCSSSLDKRIYLLNRITGRIVDRHDFLGQVVGILSQPQLQSLQRQQSCKSQVGGASTGGKIWVAAEDGQITSFTLQAEAQLASGNGAMASQAAAAADGRCPSPLPHRKVLMPRSHSSQGFTPLAKPHQHHMQQSHPRQHEQQQQQHGSGRRKQSVLNPVSDNQRLSSPLKWHAGASSPSPSPSPTPTSGAAAGRSVHLGRGGIGSGGIDRAGSNARTGAGHESTKMDLLTQTLANLRTLRQRHEDRSLHDDDVQMLRLATRWLHEAA